MNTPLGVAFFRQLDESRRRRAAWADMAGLGTVETPHVVCHTESGVRLRRYSAPRSRGPVLLLVPAPIKNHHIWDFPPPRSVVVHALARGCEVYLIEWADTPDDWSLEQAVDAIDHCVDHIRDASGHPPHVIGHSLGGTLGALHAARHPQQPASLTVVEAPLRFGNATGAFSHLLARAPTGSSLEATFGSIPGTVLNLASVMASPKEFIWDLHRDAMAAALQGGDALQTHLRALRWSLHEVPLPGKLFSQVVDHLYREDRFMQGTLVIDGKAVSPRDVAVPVAAVVDPSSHILPAASVAGFLEAVPVRNTLLLHYGGDVGVALRHVGALIGTSAHRDLWPRIFSWLEDIDRSAHGRQVQTGRNGGARPEDGDQTLLEAAH